MIIKHIPMRTVSKSHFADLADYITDQQNKQARLGQVTVTNCEAGTLEASIDEVLATQYLNTRAKTDKTYHLLVSFRAGEEPNAEALKAIEARICQGLGFQGHQRISAVHHDTDNLHMHIAVNKIHPQRLTIHDPFRAYRALGELGEQLEHEYGLEKDNHIPKRSLAEGRATDMERKAGVESLMGWIQRECLTDIQAAPSWAALHQVLQTNGLVLRSKGNGLVFEATNGIQVKASTIARDLSKPKLETRLGPWEASDKPPTPTAVKRQYQKTPMRSRVNTTALYAIYQTAQQDIGAKQRAALDKVKVRKEQHIAEAKRSNRLRRGMIKLVGDGRLSKKLLYHQASKSLLAKIDRINRQHQQARQNCFDTYKRHAWADWLKQQALAGNNEALVALRARQSSHGLKGNTIQGVGERQPNTRVAPVVDNITKQGTVIYQVGKMTVRDDGSRLQVSNDITRAGAQQALRLAAARYGDQITVNGSVEFKAHIIQAAVDTKAPITFADPLLESRRQARLTQESTHDRTEPNRRSDNRRTGGRSGDTQSGSVTDEHRTRSGDDSTARGVITSATHQRNLGRTGVIGQIPPPHLRNRLRTLSELDVVRIECRREVLLSRDVPDHVEQQRTQPTHSLRRPVSQSGSPLATVKSDHKPEQNKAMDAYISERESKRLTGIDIPKHVRYTGGEGPLSFAGCRQVEGQPLALLKRGDEMLVLPTDTATTQRLRQLLVGDPVTITDKGGIKTSTGKKTGRRR